MNLSFRDKFLVIALCVVSFAAVGHFMYSLGLMHGGEDLVYIIDPLAVYLVLWGIVFTSYIDHAKAYINPVIDGKKKTNLVRLLGFVLGVFLTFGVVFTLTYVTSRFQANMIENPEINYTRCEVMDYTFKPRGRDVSYMMAYTKSEEVCGSYEVLDGS